MYNLDGAQTTTGGSSISQFTVLHKDGSSYIISLPGPATKTSFTFGPVPLGSANVATTDGINFFGFLGSINTGAYQIGHWVGSGNSQGKPAGSLLNPTLTIAFNGEVNANVGAYRLPLTSLHTDGTLLYALDPSGDLVIFSTF